MWILTFVNVVFDIDLHILHHPCELGMNPTWLCCTIFFMSVSLFAPSGQPFPVLGMVPVLLHFAYIVLTLWSPDLSTNPLPWCLRPGCSSQWFLKLFLCFALLRLAAALFSETLGIPFYPIWSHQLGGLPVCGFLPTFTAPSQECWCSPDPFFPSFLFSFCSTHCVDTSFLEVWGLLPTFSRFLWESFHM